MTDQGSVLVSVRGNAVRTKNSSAEVRGASRGDARRRRERGGVAEAGVDEGDLEPLKIRPRDPAPALGWAIAQTAAAVLIIFAASRVFVKQLEVVGSALGLDPQLAALLFSPIATELPEVMNLSRRIIVLRQGNVAGELPRADFSQPALLRLMAGLEAKAAA